MKNRLLLLLVGVLAGVMVNIGEVCARSAGTPSGQVSTLTESPVTPALWASVARRYNWQIQEGPGKKVVATYNYTFNGALYTEGPWTYPDMGRNGQDPENPSIKPTLLVYVPKGYVSDGTWGLLVFDAYWDKFGIPSGWKPICAKRKLLLAVVQDAGNKHHDFWRQAMIAKAYMEMHAKYKLNRKRIYLVGFSGGSRMASVAAVLFSEVYKGEISNCCADYPVLVPPQNNVEGFTVAPRYLRLARQRVRFFLFTGTKDLCEQDTILAYHHLKSMGFKYVTLFDQPGAEHTQMSLENFNRGLDFLDAPLTKGVAVKIRQLRLLEKNKAFGRAMWQAQRDMNIAPGMPVCDQAKVIFNTMLPAYAKMLDSVKATIKKGNIAASNQAIMQFAHVYVPYARADVLKLRREMARKQPLQ